MNFSIPCTFVSSLAPALVGLGFFAVYLLTRALTASFSQKVSNHGPVKHVICIHEEDEHNPAEPCCEPDAEPCHRHDDPRSASVNHEIPSFPIVLVHAMFVLWLLIILLSTWSIGGNFSVFDDISGAGNEFPCGNLIEEPQIPAPPAAILHRSENVAKIDEGEMQIGFSNSVASGIIYEVVNKEFPTVLPTEPEEYVETMAVSQIDSAQHGGADTAAQVDPEKPPRKVLTVKLDRQNVLDANEETDFVRSAYFGTIMIGSPPEPFTVVFDTGSGHLVLPSTYCRSETCRMHKRYRRSSSLTGADITQQGRLVQPGQMRDQVSVSFGTGEITGVFVEDVVCVETGAHSAEDSPSLNSLAEAMHQRRLQKRTGEEPTSFLPKGCIPLRFIAATELSEDPFKSFQFDGIVGLGLEGLSQTSEFNFVKVISEFVDGWGATAPQTFGVFLADNDVEESHIALGGWSAEHIREELSWNAVPDPELGHWLVNVRGLHAGGERLKYCDTGCKAAVDTGTSLLAVPTRVFPEIFNLLKHRAPLDGNCFGHGPLLHFELDSFTVSLRPRDYAQAERASPRRQGMRWSEKKRPVPTTRDDVRCAPAMMTLDLQEPLGPKLFILGEPVLRRYYTAYDGQDKSVGFARALHADAPRRDELLSSAAVEGVARRPPTMFDVFRWKKAYF